MLQSYLPVHHVQLHCKTAIGHVWSPTAWSQHPSPRTSRSSLSLKVSDWNIAPHQAVSISYPQWIASSQFCLKQLPFSTVLDVADRSPLMILFLCFWRILPGNALDPDLSPYSWTTAPAAQLFPLMHWPGQLHHSRGCEHTFSFANNNYGILYPTRCYAHHLLKRPELKHPGYLF